MNRDPRVRDQDKLMASCSNVDTAGVCMSVGPCMTCAINRSTLAKSKIKVTVTREISQSQIVTVSGDAEDDEIIELADKLGRWSQDGTGTYSITMDPEKGKQR